MSSQNKRLRAKLLRLIMIDGKQDPSITKDLDELLQSVGPPREHGGLKVLAFLTGCH